jgi:hypothetical protein
MKANVFRSLVVVFLSASAGMLSAGEFKSAIISPGASLSINVPGDHFLKIRNFTQEGGTTRGVVTVTLNQGMSQSANVLSAAIVDPTLTSALEVINDIIVGGPADVAVTCPADATQCFISYRKDVE